MMNRGASIRAFINLEGAGGGGRELVFQSGPSNDWLIQSYATAALHPYATIIAQEVFQTGVIPSDTDYRVYRDFGGIPGIDIAYISNGYIYHTPLDTPERVLPGSLQRCGDNMVAVVRQIVTSPMMLATNAASVAQTLPSVYFDVLGMWMVLYSRATAQLINWSVTAIGMIWLYRHGGLSLRNLGGVGWLFVAMIGGMAAALSVAFILVSIGASMAWYGTPLLIIGIFVVPAMVMSAQCVRCTPCHRPSQKNKEKSSQAIALEREEASFMSALTFWLLLLIIGTACSTCICLFLSMLLVLYGLCFMNI
jgi:hypothetical protein